MERKKNKTDVENTRPKSAGESSVIEAYKKIQTKNLCMW